MGREKNVSNAITTTTYQPDINDPSGRFCWAVTINPTPKDVCGEANITLDHPRHSGENMLSRCFNFTGVKNAVTMA